MGNPFKDIVRNEKLPDSIRKRVINDVALIRLSIDMFDLGMVKYPETITNLLETLSNHKKNPDKNKKEDK